MLNGYWHSLGTSGLDNNSQADPYAVTIGNGEPLIDYTADFGYYVEPASVGNYVWLDSDEDGLQDSGEAGIDGVDVTLVIDYPDGSTVTIVTTTGDNPDTGSG